MNAYDDRSTKVEYSMYYVLERSYSIQRALTVCPDKTIESSLILHAMVSNVECTKMY